jgi:hypothetical protein
MSGATGPGEVKIVSSFGPNPPKFVVPLGIGPIEWDRLQQSELADFFIWNMDDFKAVVTLVYDIAIKAPDPGAVLQPQQGFNSFCELLTKYLMAAPSETLLWSRDEKGRYVNFFGEALMRHLRGRPIQDLYAYDGQKKHEKEWQYVYALARYVTIEVFTQGVRVDDAGIAEARDRISQLTSGQRLLTHVVKSIFK